MTQQVHPQHPPHRKHATFPRLVLSTALAVAVVVGLMPSIASASTTQSLWIARVDGKFAVQGLKFPAGAKGHVDAGIGSLNGGKDFWVQNNGYFWVEFYRFTSDKCGSAWATVKVNGITTKASKSFPCASGSSSSGGGTTTTTATRYTAASTPETAPAPASSSSTPSGWQQVFSDDFNGSSLNENEWGIYEGSGNAGVGYRKREAISVGNGELDITGRGDVAGGLALNRNYTYGRFEVRAKTDKGAGYGPATLLWPSSERWPVDGEIDISEVPNGDRHMSGSYLHWGDSNNVIGHESTGDWSQWHTYAVEWEPSKVTFSIDGNVTWTVTQQEAIPSSAHFLGLQLDVGNGGFIDGPDSSTPSAVTFHVDSVKIYQR